MQYASDQEYRSSETRQIKIDPAYAFLRLYDANGWCGRLEGILFFILDKPGFSIIPLKFRQSD